MLGHVFFKISLAIAICYCLGVSLITLTNLTQPRSQGLSQTVIQVPVLFQKLLFTIFTNRIIIIGKLIGRHFHHTPPRYPPRPYILNCRAKRKTVHRQVSSCWKILRIAS